ncbi:MAG: hypothetical protein V1900_03450 [Candidatus Aenigmatarchaeota archaeon]
MGIIQLTFWEVIGALFVLAGVFRLVVPLWVKKNKLSMLQKFTAHCKKMNATMIRVIGLLLVIIGALLIYYL